MMWTFLNRKVRYAAHIINFIAGFLFMGSLQGAQIAVMWDPSPEPDIQSYNLYYGQASRGYSGYVSVAGTQNSASLTNLVPGSTYYLAVTSRNAMGLESDYSQELSYTVPASPTGNQRPTLDPLSDVTVDEDSGAYVISLGGITSGSPTESQPLTLSAFSANTAVAPNPELNYTSPSTSGVLTLQPAPNVSGSSVITVMVDDGSTNNNTLLRTFNFTVQAANDPPTLAALTNLSLNPNPGKQTIRLEGITTGAGNEPDTLTVTATSSNPAVTGQPIVNYTHPSATGTLEFTPPTNAVGIAIITVTVNDSQAVSNTTSRAFEVLVAQAGNTVLTMTNAVIAPYTAFRYVIPSPFTNGHKITCSLDPAAPADAKITYRKGVATLSWIPSSAYASTTNLINIKIVDQESAAAIPSSTNYVVQIAVLDYLSVIPGVAAVQAGGTASLPIYVHCSDGLTNLNFSLTWPSNRFGTPSFNVSMSSLFSATVQNYSTNVSLRLRAQPGQTFNGSNLVGHLSFTVAGSHESAFVPLQTRNISGAKPNSAGYVTIVNSSGEVIVVKDVPLMRSTVGSVSGRVLNLYGKVGTSYEVQYCTDNILKPTWQPLTTYSHTNVSQTLPVSSVEPLIFYRLLQK